MDLKKVVHGRDASYIHTPTQSLCWVLASDPDDGASLIVELYSEDDDYGLGTIFRTEAAYLEEVQR